MRLPGQCVLCLPNSGAVQQKDGAASACEKQHRVPSADQNGIRKTSHRSFVCCARALSNAPHLLPHIVLTPPLLISPFVHSPTYTLARSPTNSLIRSTLSTTPSWPKTLSTDSTGRRSPRLLTIIDGAIHHGIAIPSHSYLWKKKKKLRSARGLRHKSVG